jgi:hypothetical protein
MFSNSDFCVKIAFYVIIFLSIILIYKNFVLKNKIENFTIGSQLIAKEIINASQSKAMEINNGSQSKEMEINNGSQSKEMEINNGSQSIAMEINNGSQSKAMEINNGSQSIAMEINNGSQSKAMEINNSSQSKAMEINNGSQSKAMEINNSSQSKAMEINNGESFNDSDRLFGIIPPLNIILNRFDQKLLNLKKDYPLENDIEIEKKKTCIEFKKNIIKKIFDTNHPIHNATKDMLEGKQWVFKNLNTFSENQQEFIKNLNIGLDTLMETMNEIYTGCTFGVPQ